MLSCPCPRHLCLYLFLLLILDMCDAEFVPEAVEYTTDEDGMKRVGFIEGEEPKVSPLPKEKDKEKEEEEEEKAIKAMEALNLKDKTPTGDGDSRRPRDRREEAEDEDVNNGADFDVVVPSKAEPLLPTPSTVCFGSRICCRGRCTACACCKA